MFSVVEQLIRKIVYTYGTEIYNLEVSRCLSIDAIEVTVVTRRGSLTICKKFFIFAESIMSEAIDYEEHLLKQIEDYLEMMSCIY